MTATVKDIANILDGFAPFETAEEWDNVGMLVGRVDAPVRHVLTALDVTPGVIEEARRCGAKLIVTHHPLMFHKRNRLTDADAEGALLLTLCEEQIALISLHTNYDKAPDGVNDALMRAIGMENVHGKGLLRIAELPQGTSVQVLGRCVEIGLGTKVRTYGAQEGTLTRLACCSGAGGDEIDAALEAGADAFLTGEIKHHEALYAVQRGLRVFEAGHFETERPAMETLAKALQSACDALQYNISVFCSRVNPFEEAGF